MRKRLIVVKLGGSALTDKSRAYTPRIGTIRSASKQISLLAKRFSVVVVHGAGSYGHIPVKRWRLESGLSPTTDLRHVAATKNRLLEWEMVFDSVLMRQQVPVIPLLASDWFVTRNGRIASADLRPIRNWLSLGCVPSIGGDLVTDAEDGFSILSGDQIAAYVALWLKASQLIFATDVDGIFSSNPKLDPNARLLTKLTTRSALQVTKAARISTAPDVTGGMAGKIMEAVDVASRGIPVVFLNLNKAGRLTKATLGRKVPCTRIIPG